MLSPLERPLDSGGHRLVGVFAGLGGVAVGGLDAAAGALEAGHDIPRQELIAAQLVFAGGPVLGLDQDASVFLAERLDERQEQRARSLWDGAVLNASYREMRTRLDEWLARADELELDAAAREVFLLGDKAIRQMVYDPLLPAPLVDVTARQAFFAALLHFDEAGHAIWRRLQLTNDETRAAARPTPDGARSSTRTRH